MIVPVEDNQWEVCKIQEQRWVWTSPGLREWGKSLLSRSGKEGL